MGILAAITTLIQYFIEPSRLATKVLIASLGFMAVTWLIAFFKRRSTHCPLCKGTPLINTGALPHRKAFRIFPFNHGVTATLPIIGTHKFRCMYCGTGFDILKRPSHLRDNTSGTQVGSYNTYTSDEQNWLAPQASSGRLRCRCTHTLWTSPSRNMQITTNVPE